MKNVLPIKILLSRYNFLPRISKLRAVDKCEDPKWQQEEGYGVDTFYPQGTTCFIDPSMGRSCKTTVRK